MFQIIDLQFGCKKTMQLECGHGSETWSNHLLYCNFLFTNHHSNHPCVLKSKYFWQRLLDVSHQSTCVPDHWFAIGLQENYAVRMWTWATNMIKSPTVLQLFIYKPSFQPPMRFEKQKFLTTTLGCKPSINMCSRSLICNRVARKLCS